jgi:N6-adenosine-specific RNA methylase IME4
MNAGNEIYDRKKRMKEKKELKMLERFQYDSREKTFRASTRKIMEQQNFYTDYIKGVPQIIVSDTGSEKVNIGKKRGRKTKNRTDEGSSVKTPKTSNGYNNLEDMDLSSTNSQKDMSVTKDINFNPKDSGSNIGNQSILNESHYNTNTKTYIPIDIDILRKQFRIQRQNSNENTDENEETLKIRMTLEKDYNLEYEQYMRNKLNTDIMSNNDWASKTFINCDLRFFNYDLITSRIGFFDVIMIDPPWRIKGGQRNDSSFMFSNSKFNLEYNTLSNNEIVSIPVEKLSKKGFCFLWVLNSLMNVGYECLNKWGYDVVDQITWVKTRNDKLYISQGYYFLHSSETCLIGYKCPPNERVEYKSKVASNIMFGSVRGKSQKPQEIYEIIEKMMPGAKKVELFARNNNLKDGWLSLGNQLGENYQSWKNIIHCDNCNDKINIGIKRYKSKLIPNYDICEKCFERTFSHQNVSVSIEVPRINNHIKENFFEFKNNIDEDVLHQYYSCNNCHTEPIWGNRFQCVECGNYDLCEACFDKEIASEGPEKPHVLLHDFKNYEVHYILNPLDCRISKWSKCP